MGHFPTIRDSLSLGSSVFACVSHGLSTDVVVLLWFVVLTDRPHMSTGYTETFRACDSLDCFSCVSCLRFPSEAASDWYAEDYEYIVDFDIGCLGNPESFERGRASCSGNQHYDVFRLSSSLESIRCYAKN